MFADRAKIYIQSGKGGDGHVSFRRELYVPNGGPDGGDGGRGGDIIFEVDKGLNTLYAFRRKTKYVAQNGEEGGKRRCHGADAEDLVLKVPEGTVIREFETGRVIADMSGDNMREIILKGGRGGTGNMHYATSTMQVPKYAKPGKPGKGLFVMLELKSIADVGLVGFPNAGKSTFLSRVTNADPKIADYPFTTITPNLGVVDFPDGGFVIADIPGLVEGASEGLGLGHDFLRHIDRTKVLIHMVDAAGTEGRDPVEDVATIREELRRYDPALLERPQVIAANKVDITGDEDLFELMEEESPVKRLRDAYGPLGLEVYPISAATGQGVKELLYRVKQLLDELPPETTVYEREYDPETFVDREDLPYTVEKGGEGLYVVEGPRIEKMLGYTNLDSEKGFAFFQDFLKNTGILDELKDLGIQEGDTVRMYGLEFDYYE
ncbi:MAG: GTPase ObgE [Lachnospiraceae bacterium]|nr:GTPase ObgE [Lachnospiraceae bacterium]